MISTTGLYMEFFGLSERPFTLLPDPDFLYWSPGHQRAFTVLEYGIVSRAPITVITGEVGSGKTTLIQKLLQILDDTVTVGLISNAQGGRGALLQWVLNVLDVDYGSERDYVTLFQLLQDLLIEEYAAGRRVLLIIDEAQNLSIEGLEELRMMTNINANKDELLQLLLVGQPELRDTIARPELRQFAQRVVANLHIGALDLEGVTSYITHRMRTVGGTGEEFTDDAIVWIHHASGGIPRIINKICDFALTYAATSETPHVDAGIVEDVLQAGLFITTHETTDEAAE